MPLCLPLVPGSFTTFYIRDTHWRAEASLSYFPYRDSADRKVGALALRRMGLCCHQRPTQEFQALLHAQTFCSDVSGSIRVWVHIWKNKNLPLIFKQKSRIWNSGQILFPQIRITVSFALLHGQYKQAPSAYPCRSAKTLFPDPQYFSFLFQLGGCSPDTSEWHGTHAVHAMTTSWLEIGEI